MRRRQLYTHLTCVEEWFKTMETKCERFTFVSFKTNAAQVKLHHEGRLPELWPGVNNARVTYRPPYSAGEMRSRKKGAERHGGDISKRS